MAAGDVDDKLGPEGELQRLRQRSPQLDSYLKYMDSRPIARAGVPFGAGISKSGQLIYIDPRLDTNLDGVDVSSALSAHEQVEWGLREYLKIGESYAEDPKGHRLANRAEYEVVSSLFPSLSPDEAWDMYDEFIDPQIRKIESAPISNVPDDLATYPYEADEEMMEKINAAWTFRRSPNGDQQCSTCAMFTAPDRCTYVTQVVPYGWCEEWEEIDADSSEEEGEGREAPANRGTGEDS